MLWLWIGFLVFVVVMLALDLGVLHRKSHVVRTREALLFSGFCGLMALSFTVVVYFLYENHWLGVGDARGPLLPANGWDAAIMFLSGWVVEQSLSLDNIFVIAMIFSYFGVPLEYQRRTLFWGIMGALVFRLVMILAGAALIDRFHWIIYVFGALLLYTAWKMLRAGEQKIHPDRNVFVRLARRMYPISSGFDREHFFTRIPLDSTTPIPREQWSRRTDWRAAATPLFLVLLVIESTDVLFAVDSIPAIFGITRDPFLVFTSNVFAILNLRSMYFALANLLERFFAIKYSLVFILAYVGVKMMLTDIWHPPAYVTLLIIAAALTAGVLISLRRPASAPRRCAACHAEVGPGDGGFCPRCDAILPGADQTVAQRSDSATAT